MSLVRVVRFTLAADHQSSAQSIGDDLVPAIKSQTGCAGAWFAADADGECALVVLWNGQQEADAAAVVISPRLEGHITGNVIGQPDIHLLPILAS